MLKELDDDKLDPVHAIVRERGDRLNQETPGAPTRIIGVDIYKRPEVLPIKAAPRVPPEQKPPVPVVDLLDEPEEEVRVRINPTEAPASPEENAERGWELVKVLIQSTREETWESSDKRRADAVAAAFADSADLAEISLNTSEAFDAGVWLNSEQQTMQTIVLPATSGPKLLETLQRVERHENKLIDPEVFAAQVSRAQSSNDAELVRSQEYTKDDIARSLAESGVSFAGGDSDNESIRDFESGSGPNEWHKRDPYFHRREMNLNQVRYRRRYKMTIEATTTQMKWHPEVDSDEDDGYVRQTSFILSPQLATDEFGVPTGLPAEELLDYVTAGASKVMPRTFQGIRKETQIVDEVLPTKPPVSADLTLQAEDRQNWLNEIQDSSPEAIIEGLYAILKTGERKDNKVGQQRKFECVSCSIGILKKLDTTTVCTTCQDFICSDCKSQHYNLHISQTLQRGLEKRADDEAIRERQKADHDRIV